MSVLQEKLTRIGRIRERRPSCGDIFDFFEKIFTARDAVLQRVAVADPYPDGAGIAIRLRDGFPLLEKRLFLYDAEALADYFFSLLDIVAQRNPQGAASIRSRADAARKLLKDLPPVDIVQSLALFGSDSDLALFLLKESMRPWLEKYAEVLGPKVQEGLWAEGACPVCGGFPFFAEIAGEENRRRLFCQDCGAAWQFPRLQCPFCGVDDPAELGYFRPDDETQYRVMTCRACKRYLKTADFRERDETLVPEVDHPATFHLDVIARERGYKTEDVLTRLLL